jgi:enoyl-[acyl-carrier protein] reductase I
MSSNLLKGKKIAVFGVANKWSIAWAISQALSAAGAQLALTFIDERTEENVRDLAKTLPHHPLILPCDVTNDLQIEAVFSKLKHEFGELDSVIHAIAFARKEELEGTFLKTTRAGFAQAMDISAYSLTALAREATPLMKGRNGCLVSLSFLGGVRVFPNYNVMGVAKAALEMSIRYLAADLGHQHIRVNGISAGPVNTLAARGIADFRTLLNHYAHKAPLKRNIEAAEVADTAVYLCSDLARGVTGEILYVDAGYHVIGA